jgi:hypothetical protein
MFNIYIRLVYIQVFSSKDLDNNINKYKTILNKKEMASSIYL